LDEKDHSPTKNRKQDHGVMQHLYLKDRIAELEKKVVQWLAAISRVAQMSAPARQESTTELSADMSPRSLENG